MRSVTPEKMPYQPKNVILSGDSRLKTLTSLTQGAAYVAGGGFDPDPGTWPGQRQRVAMTGTPRSGRAPAVAGVGRGDPTGCGDVWGATFFARLLAGDPLEAALTRANVMAAKNLEFRGAKGLEDHLRGRLTRSEESR